MEEKILVSMYIKLCPSYWKVIVIVHKIIGSCTYHNQGTINNYFSTIITSNSPQPGNVALENLHLLGHGQHHGDRHRPLVQAGTRRGEGDAGEDVAVGELRVQERRDGVFDPDHAGYDVGHEASIREPASGGVVVEVDAVGEEIGLHHRGDVVVVAGVGRRVAEDQDGGELGCGRMANAKGYVHVHG